MHKTIFKFFYLLHLICKYNLSFCIKKNNLLKFILQFFAIFYVFYWYKQKTSIRLRKSIQEMGIIYIKFAQHICSFSNYLDIDTIHELKLLQTKLPCININYINTMLKQELGTKLKDISNLSKTPIGVASIAQVHKAELLFRQNNINSSNINNNEDFIFQDNYIKPIKKTIAIKIIKPLVKQQYQNDINFLYNIAKILNFFSKKVKRFNLFSTIQIFESSMQNEINLLSEASACITMKKQNIRNLIIPKIYLTYSTENILVMDFIDGVNIDEAIKNKNNYNLQLIAKNLAWIFFTQSYHNGFFHADMHEGNILILPDNKIALLDFGIVGELKNKDKIAVTQILQGFLECNYKKIAAIHYYAGYIPKDTNLIDFEIAIAKIGELIVNKKMHQISISLLLKNLLNVTKSFNMQVQPQLILLQKTTLSLEELIKTLDSNLNPWELATPWIQSWAKTYISPCAILKRYIKQQIQNIFSLKGIFNAYEED